MIRIPVSHDHYPSEALKWCKKNFGPIPGGRWWYDARIFYFCEEKDATLFLLRWS